jgi:hypothetical protein
MAGVERIFPFFAGSGAPNQNGDRNPFKSLHNERKNTHALKFGSAQAVSEVDATREVFAATWLKQVGPSIGSFKTTFAIPPEPSTRSDQLLYIFLGMQNRLGEIHILQPVLQWGINSDGIGEKVSTISSWCVAAPENGGKQRSGQVKVAANTIELGGRA